MKELVEPMLTFVILQSTEKLRQLDFTRDHSFDLAFILLFTVIIVCG
jgi:hypothetical protein